MKLKTLTLVYKIMAIMAIGSCLSSPSYAALPKVTLVATPGGTSKNTAIFPIVVAEKTTNNLATVSLDYSWDNVNWTALAGNPSPSATIAWEGNALYVSPASTPATLYIRGSATDSAAQSNSITTAVTVGSTSAYAPSVLTGDQLRGTYNYGLWWMKESGGSEKIWWTGGDNYGASGGDALYFKQLGGANLVLTLNQNQYSNNLMSDPCVIKGSFSGGYSYAMYFTQLPIPGQHNDVAVSFSSNGYSGWTTPVGKVYSFYLSDTNPDVYGAGYASVINIQSGGGSRPYCMFNTDKGNGAWEVWFRRSTDGISWSNTQASSASDITNNGYATQVTMPSDWQIFSRFAYYGGYWYVAVCTKAGAADCRKIKVYSALADTTTLAPGSWTLVGTIDDSQIMTRKETCAFRVDENGYLSGGSILVGFQTSELNQWPGTYPYDGSQLYYAIPAP